VGLCAYSENELERNIRGSNWVMYRSIDGDGGRGRFGLREMEASEGREERLRLEWGREYG